MKVCFYTFGCKLNQAETEEFKNRFNQEGVEIGFSSSADFYVINACAVTQKAEREVRQLIHRLKRRNPKAILVVIGCFSQELVSQEKRKVNFWLDNNKKQDLKKLVFEKFKIKKSVKPPKIDVKIRSLVKIQSGCRHFCSYCLVPFLRNKIYSRPVNQIIKEIKEKEKNGCQEIVLVGTNIGDYFDRRAHLDLIGCVKRVLKKTTISRLRLSSIWPTKISQELINLFKKNSRLCPHFHLSVQSGSDCVLKLMNRKYSQKDLLKIIKKLKTIPDLNLTADLIVGFPGESKNDFRQTCRLVKEARFLKVHVFRYSNRPLTKAGNLPTQIDEKTKQRRGRELAVLAKKISQERKKDFLNQQAQVLIEGKKGSYWQGFTKNYLKVFVLDRENLKNKIIQVKLKKLFKDGLIGERCA